MRHLLLKIAAVPALLLVASFAFIGPATGAGDDDDGVSKQDAAQAVVDEYGGCIINVEDDDYDGEPAWEVEARDTNTNEDAGGRIEVKVDKANGEIVDTEEEDSDDDEECDDSYPSADDDDNGNDGSDDGDNDGSDGGDAASVSVHTDASNYAAGESIVVNGDGVDPGSEVGVELHSSPVTLGTVDADADGNYRLKATLPDDVSPGKHTVVVTATADGAEVTSSMTITITAKVPTKVEGGL